MVCTHPFVELGQLHAVHTVVCENPLKKASKFAETLFHSQHESFPIRVGGVLESCFGVAMSVMGDVFRFDSTRNRGVEEVAFAKDLKDVTAGSRVLESVVVNQIDTKLLTQRVQFVVRQKRPRFLAGFSVFNQSQSGNSKPSRKAAWHTLCQSKSPW